MNKVTIKQKAITLIERLNCTWKRIPCNPFDRTTMIEVFVPDGFMFDDDCHSYICDDWRDVIGRLSSCHLVKDIVGE